MNKDAKIYIAGHRGLAGSALVRKTFFAQDRPEYVFLAAAKVGGIVANNTYTAEFIYDNFMVASNVINAAYSTEVKKLLNLGSICIYPKMAPQPMKEEHPHYETRRHSPQTARCKLDAEARVEGVDLPAQRDRADLCMVPGFDHHGFLSPDSAVTPCMGRGYPAKVGQFVHFLRGQPVLDNVRTRCNGSP